MTVEEARASSVCRICGKNINVPTGQPKGWESEFGEMVYPLAITLNFGDEFAHTACLPADGGAAPANEPGE
jgi:hypothetical protein